MKPIIKYQGGKTKEIPIISKLQPQNYSRIFEHFCGGAAVSLFFEKKCLLNDINFAVVNLYNTLSTDDYFVLQSRVDNMKKNDHDILEKEFYSSRDIINNHKQHSSLDYAFAYIVVRQLCFSGMERYNSSGMFNVPFGHYKKFSSNLSINHHDFFSKNVEIKSEDAIKVIEGCNESDWIFLDPPYLDRLGYSTGDGGLDLHDRLVNAMKSTKSKWLFIHSDCEYYRDNLSEFNIQSEKFNYSQNFGKNKNHSNAKVNHIYVTNYS